MNRKFIYIICCTIAILTLYGCPKDIKYSLSLHNHSDQTVTVSINNDRPGIDPTYPDTILKESFTPYLSISPNNSDSFRHSGIPWWSDRAGFDTLSFLVVSVDTLNKYSWDEIRSSYNILQRYDLSRSDLRLLDATIHYPSTEAMRNMKMYPAYGKSK